jgi:broad specificity phosphatase PhoE
LGHAQAALLADRLLAMQWPIARVWCSTLVRAQETMQHMRDRPKMEGFTNYVSDERLCEGRP